MGKHGEDEGENDEGLGILRFDYEVCFPCEGVHLNPISFSALKSDENLIHAQIFLKDPYHSDLHHKG